MPSALSPLACDDIAFTATLLMHLHVYSLMACLLHVANYIVATLLTSMHIPSCMDTCWQMNHAPNKPIKGSNAAEELMKQLCMAPLYV